MSEPITPVEHEGLCERLEKAANASFEANKSFGRRGPVWALETELEWQAATTIRTQAAELERLRGALITARAAIASLSEYALGEVSQEDDYGGFEVHGIRDELLSEIDRALSDTPPEKNGTTREG